MFYRDEEVLTAVALKAALLHVVGKIRKFGPGLRFDPFPRKVTCGQNADKGKESQVAVEHTKDDPESDSEKYRGHWNPNVIDINRTKTHHLSKQAFVGDQGEFLSILALAFRACQFHRNSPFLKYRIFWTSVHSPKSRTITVPTELPHTSAKPPCPLPPGRADDRVPADEGSG